VIYDRYLPLVLRWSLRETGNRDVAADLAAETFAAALIASPRLSERWRAVNLSCDGGGWWLFSVDALAYLGPRPWLLGR